MNHKCLFCGGSFAIGATERCPRVCDSGEHQSLSFHNFREGRFDGLCAEPTAPGLMCGYPRWEGQIHAESEVQVEPEGAQVTTEATTDNLKAMIRDLVTYTPIMGPLLDKARAMVGMPPAVSPGAALGRDYSGIPEHLTQGTTWDPGKAAEENFRSKHS